MNKIKICSSPTISGLEQLINNYFYSTTYKIVEMKVFKRDNLMDNFKIVKKGKSFLFFIVQ